jgi:hypothetical protein
VRFVLEVAFLGGLAALATVARMRPEAVVAVMVFGWVVVALAEWSSWLDRPHFGRGLPPRFYVPQVSLPPPQPIEQLALRLPSGGRRAEDEETWIAASATWSTAFDDWPVLDLDRLGEDTVIARPDAPGDDTVVGTLHAPLEEPDAGSPLEPAELAPPLEHPAALPPPLEQPPELPVPLDPALGPLLVPEPGPPAEPVPEPGSLPEPETGPIAAPPGDEEPIAAPPREPELHAPVAPPMLARHRVDPFASAGRARRWRRRHDGGGIVEVPDRPPPGRPPPSAVGQRRPTGPRR